MCFCSVRVGLEEGEAERVGGGDAQDGGEAVHVAGAVLAYEVAEPSSRSDAYSAGAELTLAPCGPSVSVTCPRRMLLARFTVHYKCRTAKPYTLLLPNGALVKLHPFSIPPLALLSAEGLREREA